MTLFHLEENFDQSVSEGMAEVCATERRSRGMTCVSKLTTTENISVRPDSAAKDHRQLYVAASAKHVHLHVGTRRGQPELPTGHTSIRTPHTARTPHNPSFFRCSASAHEATVPLKRLLPVLFVLALLPIAVKHYTTLNNEVVQTKQKTANLQHGMAALTETVALLRVQHAHNELHASHAMQTTQMPVLDTDRDLIVRREREMTGGSRGDETRRDATQKRGKSMERRLQQLQHAELELTSIRNTTRKNADQAKSHIPPPSPQPNACVDSPAVHYDATGDIVEECPAKELLAADASKGSRLPPTPTPLSRFFLITYCLAQPCTGVCNGMPMPPCHCIAIPIP